ncbi:hypothetical protein GCM10011415_08840 [Salipiger pallidus]|uniref:Copper(I)-binding protein n=1 Tax=Salipiger pallidus TaxID=1775170 RepID=A0A8J2ZHS6_9RHOB|nr:copper chaperone PCu(A)C [Salipiger pallidus]GGG64468.1 hypothetical protein GCM10011415_08840 [Salipiger pallidus]
MKTLILAGAVALAAGPAFADITVTDAYVRSAMPGAPTGAAFMVIGNDSGSADRLVSVASDAAKRVELHTHISDDNGVMKMTHVEEGFAIPANGEHVLARGGDHVMFMGLNEPLVQGETVTVTLTFENAGAVTIEIPVDSERQPDHGAMQTGMDGGHGDHDDHGK